MKRKRPLSKPQRIYFDSCILIALFSTKSSEGSKKQEVKKALQFFEDLTGVQFFISHWALAEMTNILICNHKMKAASVSKIEQELLNRERIGGLKVRVLDVSPKDNYSVKEYLYDVRQVILKFHSGVGDCMHSVVIKNHGIDTIMTLDMKPDFKQIPGLIVFHPKDVNEAFARTSIST